MKKYIENYKSAIKDFIELKKKINSKNIYMICHKNEFEELCDDMGGHNFEYHNTEETKGLFDLNYKSLCATIYYNCDKEDTRFYLSENVEVWGDDLIGTYDINDLILFCIEN